MAALEYYFLVCYSLSLLLMHIMNGFGKNGLPAPKGENEQSDRTFAITIVRGEKVGEIRSGAW